MIIGILALQGGIEEHQKALESLGVNVKLVKKEEDLNDLDGLILPGGESTTITYLLKETDLLTPLKEKIKNGLPTYGTCCGMILLAKEVENEDGCLKLMDIRVKRNAYGAQSSSFKKEVLIKEISNTLIPLVFIRAPYIEKVNSNVEVILSLDDKIVFAKQDNMLVSSFHPELTNNLEIHKYFLKMINK